ncbi:uncharacterized protein LOC122266218 [Penaeus japonicus]|uniref:uncharacterized protein LOC122266218 n=1 Tax=Penaeus japonicus TaxID=27405 RepID=UPI001C713216|nr:uncharacterized protein LOC122266218 [Penaeus japonicus]
MSMEKLSDQLCELTGVQDDHQAVVGDPATVTYESDVHDDHHSPDLDVGGPGTDTKEDGLSACSYERVLPDLEIGPKSCYLPWKSARVKAYVESSIRWCCLSLVRFLHHYCHLDGIVLI